MPLMGNSCWASFQNKRDLDEQRFIGFSFPVLVTFQSVERKRVASFSLVDINCICPKKEARSKQPNKDVGQTRRPHMKLWLGSWHTAPWQVSPQKAPVSSIPSMPLKGGQATVRLSLHLDGALSFLMSLFLGMSVPPFLSILLSILSWLIQQQSLTISLT